MTAVTERARVPAQLRFPRFSALVAVADPILRDSVVQSLTKIGVAGIEQATTVAQARLLAHTNARGLCVAQTTLPDGSGASLVSDLRRIGWARGVVLAATEDPFAVRGALAAGVRCYLVTTRPAGPVAVPTATGDVEALSGREVEVLQLVADGCSNRDIGRELGLSALTVKSHLARIGRKLGTGDRAEMVAVCLRTGVIS